MKYIRLYNTVNGIFAYHQERYYRMEQDWDALVNSPRLFTSLQEAIEELEPAADAAAAIQHYLLPPIGSQEIWAAGVTYLRSMVARKEESEIAGGATFYDKVYEAERPELFFKSLAHRAVGHGQAVYIRKDSTWNVPEPELTLFLNSAGEIQGYTVGNDMSSRSIEGENPLYLPQAKVYEKSAAIGPCLLVPEQPLPVTTQIHMQILRQGQPQYNEAVPISQMKRGHQELAAYLFRECDFPFGCYLMTGTCLVPDSSFTLQENDVVEITIEPVGTLVNIVEIKK
ncbi:fumarylacetoacetate hydrolase family protein [Chitinophaga japonensis]|uniref:2-dehydro-3-deoxy-D-arabinonate dehydratase n=1 Tax=Chitinophaga japonensis TaxID=104662 RepID=A0A562SZ71_CHIJA|nr:fumarylacetoacetate hydrolase family protein [Chitinophaga japonensis]TWI86615.1 2-dehydro-3-deoxy-D-arabinonate dehydratase [Chitinophaga japonensis]